ncbi:MAG: hypothetical protein HFF06_02455 [Oscillospiraceae bacterium]|nr:hypothetical protein [Oscillospiraceae bacterium]
MFERWKEEELTAIRRQYGKIRLLTWAFLAIMLVYLLNSVVMLLDGGGAIGAVSILIQLGLMAVIWRLGDYKGRFFKPLLSSVEETLTTQGEREEFAQQMGQAEEILCTVTPQGRPCRVLVGKEYLYIRQPGKSRILKNRDIRRVKLTRESYTVGRGHIRTCCCLYLYTAAEKYVWTASLPTEGECYRVWDLLRPNLPTNIEVDDRIAYGKTEEGRKADRRSELVQIILAALLVGVLILVVKLLK